MKDEFDGTSGKITVLQEQLTGKARDFGWNNNDTSDIINIPLEDEIMDKTRNIINEYSQLTTEAITEWALDNIVGAERILLSA